MNRYLWLLLIILQLGFADVQRLRFTPGLYSFESIARRLSVGGRYVVCAANLQQRMAFLSLSEHDWETVRCLLEGALDLEIVCTDPEKNQWLLRRKPSSIASERKLCERLAQVITRRLDNQLPNRYPNWLAIFQSLPAPLPESELSHLQDWLEEFEEFSISELPENDEDSLRNQLKHKLEKFGKLPPTPTLIQWAQHQSALSPQEFLQRFGTYFGELMLSLPEASRVPYVLLALAEGLRAHEQAMLSLKVNSLLQGWTPVKDAIMQGVIFRTTVLPNEAYAILNIPQAAEPPIGCLVYKFSSDSDNLRFVRLGCVVTPSDIKPLPDDNGEVVFETTTEGLAALFKEMEISVYQQYMQATERHKALFSQIPSEWQRRLQRIDLSYSFYGWLKDFTSQRNQEAIAELYPERSLFAESEGAWRLELIHGVWVWRNWLAFVDRIPDYPLATLQKLALSARTLNNWQRFVRQVSLTQARWLTLTPLTLKTEAIFGTSEPLGSLPSVGHQWLLFQVLDAVPQWESRLKRTDTLTIAWQELAPAKRRAWVQRLLQVGTEGLPEALHPWVWLGRADVLVQSLEQAGVVRVSRVRGGVSVVLQVGEQQWLGCVIPLKLGQD